MTKKPVALKRKIHPDRPPPTECDGVITVHALMVGWHPFTVSSLDAWVLGSNWYLQNAGYLRRNHGGKGKQQYLHRLVAHSMRGGQIDDFWIPTSLQVDHLDRNRMNNTRVNLRLGDRTLNNLNRGAAEASTYAEAGVSWDDGSNSWRAQLMYEGSFIWIGRFPCPKQASAAVRARRERLVQEHLVKSDAGVRAALPPF